MTAVAASPTTVTVSTVEGTMASSRSCDALPRSPTGYVLSWLRGDGCAEGRRKGKLESIGSISDGPGAERG